MKGGRSGGETSDPRDVIDLQDHDPDWAEEFERERERLASALGHTACRIDHVGSIAVPGLRAMPVIPSDMLRGDGQKHFLI